MFDRSVCRNKTKLVSVSYVVRMPCYLQICFTYWLLWRRLKVGFQTLEPGHVAQSVARLTQEAEVRWVRYPVWLHTFVSPSADSRRAVVSAWQKSVHEVLVKRLGGLRLPRKSVVMLNDRPDLTIGVYRGRKTRTQQQ